MIASLVTVLPVMLHHAAQIVGERSFGDIVGGRYHRPRAEERFFLFVDVWGSTPVAERMGPLAVHRCLDRVFQVASAAVDTHYGEIYQYVGDEMVVTWTLAEGRSEARPLACLFAVEAALSGEAPRFEREFGTVPKIRAALHAGEVVTGEIWRQSARHCFSWRRDERHLPHRERHTRSWAELSPFGRCACAHARLRVLRTGGSWAPAVARARGTDSGIRGKRALGKR